MTEPPTAPIPTSVQARERARLGAEIDRWVLRPLRWLPLAGQVWLTFGAHAFLAWAFGAKPGEWDGQWAQAWVAILLLDGALLTTYHARTSRRLPPEAYRLAAWVYVPGFVVSMLANFGNRVLNVGPPPGWLDAIRGVIAGLGVVLPFGLVLVAVPLYGMVKVYRDTFRRADDEEVVAELERREQAEQEAERRAARAVSRRVEKALRDTSPAASPATSPAAGTSPAGAEPAAGRSRAAETRPERPASAPSGDQVAGQAGGPVAAEEGGQTGKADRYVLARWVEGADPDGGEVDRNAKVAASTGRKRLTVLRAAHAHLVACRATGSEPTADEIDEHLVATLPPSSKGLRGTGARLLDAYPPDPAGGNGSGNSTPVLASVPAGDAAGTDTPPGGVNVA